MSTKEKLEFNNADASQLLLRVFEWLDAAGIKYCVERNYHGYPDNLTGDLDLVVSDYQIIEVARGITAVSGEMDWFCYQEHVWEKSAYLGLGKSVFPNRFALTIELFAGARWHGLPYLLASEILEKRLKTGITWRPSPAHQAIITSIHHLLYNECVPKKYRDEILVLFNEEPDLFKISLRSPLGSKLADQIAALISAADWATLENKAQKMKAALVTRKLIFEPLRTIKILWEGFGAKRNLPEGAFLIVSSDTDLLASNLCQALLKLADDWHLFVPPTRKVIYINENIAGKFKEAVRITQQGGVAIVNFKGAFGTNLLLQYPYYGIHLNTDQCKVVSSGVGWTDNNIRINKPLENLDSTTAQIWDFVLADRAKRRSG